ncbi:hypothetical protein [Flammeovirga sp. SubArs3]|uniref:hypothetical protein n=1 Tax=Flammeovirga sp. SubArs3 TaxID=2995316 RepID=UPI00248B60D1|nr:hypothetical protein [Flammeovirga sp. SubArs3]
MKIREIENELWLNWTATSDDVNFYDERAKPTQYEFNVRVNLLELTKEEDISTRWKKLTNKGEVYFKVLRDMRNGRLFNNDKRIYAPLGRERTYYDAITAWKEVPRLMSENDFEFKF